MSGRAQHNYYAMRPASDVLNARIEALNAALPRGSTVVDIGCNDGSISHALVEMGAIARSYCYDREDILRFDHPGLEFREQIDLAQYDLTKLPDADGVLLLNILHHIVGSSPERAKEIIDYLIDRYMFVLIDMGSFTENGNWGWRKTYDKTWRNDADMWNFLFSKAAWRFKLLRYPTQGKGHRILWKLYKQPYLINDLEIIETFKRPPGAWPADKKMIPLSEVGETKVAEWVEFSLALSRHGDRFWIKRYCDHRKIKRTELELEIANQVLQAVVHVNARTSRDLRAVCPVGSVADALIYIYEPDLAEGTIVHFQDWAAFFPPEDCRAAGILGARPLTVRDIRIHKLIEACDYQICASWDGLAVLDFEPNSWMLRYIPDGATE